MLASCVFSGFVMAGELPEQLCLLRVSESAGINTDVSINDNCRSGLLHCSEEVLLLIFKRLDPFSLLRVGLTCSKLFRVCSCNSLWTRHLQVSFRVVFSSTACSITAKQSFALMYMWRTLYRSLRCNRSLQEKLFGDAPASPQRYWSQWLVLEHDVPLPPVQLASSDIASLWGIREEDLEVKTQGTAETEETNVVKFGWRELHALALSTHGSLSALCQHVLHQHRLNDHSELETLFHQYIQCRFQWYFTYWLFRQPPPLDRQLRSLFLQWRRHSKRKVSAWGGTLCDVRYLASMHRVTADYWRGKLACSNESEGIQTVENYFSMCKSLVAWILGRDWGRLKRRKVYEDTLDGVYRLLRREMHEALVEHETFWQVAKVQMGRVCRLADTANNYVNWKMIEMLPYYRLYLVSGNSVYLDHVQGFLGRKRLIHNWIHLEENAWVRQLLSDQLYVLLEFDTKISQDSLHGDGVLAQLSRLVWLYLHSGQQLYMEAVKGFVLQCAHTDLQCYTHLLAPACLAPPTLPRP